MKTLILGTAGHIDHGKTSLVRLLTGVNTDRLKEEQERGITIELGFAGLDLSDGTHVGIVDVPGHEKFVKTMVAGAGGIDLVCMVIAADEGVMPQTREHFEVCRLLGVEIGLVALTKSDMVDADWLDLVTEDVAEYLEGSFLEGAPIVPVSSSTGDGKQAVLDAIESQAQKAAERKASDIFRLPVDRVFTMKGFGTVITGSGIGGTVSVGETVEVLPSNKQAKVRGLQVHNDTVETAGAGLRTAVNFQGLDRDEINRGEVLIKPGALEPSYMVDARIEYLASAPKPLKFRTQVRFHHLTSEILARVVPMTAEEFKPGETGVVQFRLEAPAVVLPGDRFVVRSYSPAATIGGGVVLNPRPKKHKRPFESALAGLDVLESGTTAERMLLFFKGADKNGMAFSNLAALLGVSNKEMLTVYRDLLSKGDLIRFDNEADRAVDGETFARVSEAVLAKLEQFHMKQPTLEGQSQSELAGKVEYGVPPKLLARVLAKLEKEKKVRRSGERVALAGHKAELTGGLEALGDKVRAAIADGGVKPPTLKELQELAGGGKGKVQTVLDLLISKGGITRVSENLYYDNPALDAITEKLKAHLDAHGEIDAPGFKELTGLSRKYTIPLLEYFDAAKVTIRVGDKRVPRKQ
jgi:selenocysteine-specific elongation factor